MTSSKEIIFMHCVDFFHQFWKISNSLAFIYRWNGFQFEVQLAYAVEVKWIKILLVDERNGDQWSKLKLNTIVFVFDEQ